MTLPGKQRESTRASECTEFYSKNLTGLCGEVLTCN